MGGNQNSHWNVHKAERQPTAKKNLPRVLAWFHPWYLLGYFCILWLLWWHLEITETERGTCNTFQFHTWLRFCSSSKAEIMMMLHCRNTALIYFSDDQKGLMNSEKSSLQKAKLWIAGRASVFRSSLGWRLFYLSWASRRVHCSSSFSSFVSKEYTSLWIYFCAAKSSKPLKSNISTRIPTFYDRHEQY